MRGSVAAEKNVGSRSGSMTGPVADLIEALLEFEVWK